MVSEHIDWNRNGICRYNAGQAKEQCFSAPVNIRSKCKNPIANGPAIPLMEYKKNECWGNEEQNEN